MYQKMAEEALALDLIERVEKFSFATLYTGELYCTVLYCTVLYCTVLYYTGEL